MPGKPIKLGIPIVLNQPTKTKITSSTKPIKETNRRIFRNKHEMKRNMLKKTKRVCIEMDNNGWLKIMNMIFII